MNGKVFTFYLCERLFGIDITAVEEINRSVEYTPVPSAREHIVGLFNMRGQIVTLFDIAKKLKYRERCEYNEPTCVTLKPSITGEDLVGFLIDRPNDVIDVKEEECEPLPANASDTETEYIKEVIKSNDQLIMLIDAKKLFEYKE